MEESRTKKTIRNTAFSFGYKFFDVIFAFILRSVFIKTLSVSYLGLNGLFTNVLTVLSLMELGVGSSIVFSLYKPLAENNYPKVAALMQLYKRTYNIIGILVCGVGFALTPFLKYIINLPENVDNIYPIYWLIIANTGVSYFLAYRRSLLMADQRSDINSKNLILFRFVRFALLIFALLVFRNYIIYLAFDILVTVLSNIHSTVVIKSKYKYLETVKPEQLTKDEKHNIVKYMTSSIYYKVGHTVVNGTDNIIISAFISTVLVGIYSNYAMIISNLDIFIDIVFGNMTASIGNFAVCNSDEKSENLFKKINSINYYVVFIISVCLLSLFSPFITIWIGGEFTLSTVTVIFIVINFYLRINQYSINSFIGAVGELNYINRHRSLIEGVVNLVVSIALVKFTDLGITGVFIGTTVCFLCGRVWMDARTLYKHWFKMPFRVYLKTYILRFLLCAVTTVVCKVISDLIFTALGINIFTWLLVAFVCVAISVGVILAVFRKTDEFKYFVDLFGKVTKKILKK